VLFSAGQRCKKKQSAFQKQVFYEKTEDQSILKMENLVVIVFFPDYFPGISCGDGILSLSRTFITSYLSS